MEAPKSSGSCGWRHSETPETESEVTAFDSRIAQAIRKQPGMTVPGGLADLKAQRGGISEATFWM